MLSGLLLLGLQRHLPSGRDVPGGRDHDTDSRHVHLRRIPRSGLPRGSTLPEAVHGHATFCCGVTDGGCEQDSDCCSETCSQGHCGAGAAYASCSGDSDCIGNCQFGECAPVEIGGTCGSSSECDVDLLCQKGICTCLTASSDAVPGSESSDCCVGWSFVSGNDGQCQCSGIAGSRCSSDADCCYSGGTCSNYTCTTSP